MTNLYLHLIASQIQISRAQALFPWSSFYKRLCFAGFGLSENFSRELRHIEFNFEPIEKKTPMFIQRLHEQHPIQEISVFNRIINSEMTRSLQPIHR